jgi:hypothetical protein
MSLAGAVGSAAAGPIMRLTGYSGVSALAAAVVVAAAVALLGLPARSAPERLFIQNRAGRRR